LIGSALPSNTNSMVKQVVAALMVRGQEILCCQRTEYQALPLKWEFPGGKIEPGENPPEALVRELEEELGVHAEIGAKVAQLQHRYHNGNAVELHFFVVERFDGELQNRIFREIRWVNRRDLPTLDFLDADRTLVQQIASGELL
jgi:8-oxo-dGTP diphosphatase